LVAGLGGLREDGEDLELAPLLPTGITRTRFHVTWRGTVLRVEPTTAGTTVAVVDGAGPATVVVDGERVEVTTAPVTVPLREAAPLRAEPTQPEGCAPRAWDGGRYWRDMSPHSSPRPALPREIWVL